MNKKPPIAMQWQFDETSLKRKKYLKDLDFIKANTEVNMLNIATVHGVVAENNSYFHDDLNELVNYAHSLGIKVLYRSDTVTGFFNDVPHIIKDQSVAQGITIDTEGIVGEDGYFECTVEAKYARRKLLPLYNELLKVYLFEKSGEGFYKDGSLVDITDSARVVLVESNRLSIEVNAGRKNAGKNIFVLTCQYFNCNDLYSGAMLNQFKSLMDFFSDIQLDGFLMDETGYMPLDFISEEEPFRGRLYSKAHKAHFEREYSIDLPRLLFDMRYAPEGNDKVRIRAINKYFEDLQLQPIRNEHEVAEYQKKLWGEGVFLSCHNTFHNRLDSDEIWKTGCRWWDLPRDFGHTDENITFPVRMGVSLSCPEPICLDMFYKREKEPYYDHIINAAPFNCRQFHHSYNDGVWGQGFTDPDFLEKIRMLDKSISKLDEYQTERVLTDILVIYGNSAQNNWYPNYSARNKWDIDGSLGILEKCDEMWKAGYRLALVPDYTITDGRTKILGDKVTYNGYEFSHLIFMYPKYAKKEVFSFLNDADERGVSLAVVGNADLDFDGDYEELRARRYDDFTFSILDELGCEKRAIDGGALYVDKSFSLVSHSLLRGDVTEFDFTVDGIRYSGYHTGILFYRPNKVAVATAGSKLFVDGRETLLELL